MARLQLLDINLAEAMAAADVIVRCTPTGMHTKEGVSLVPAHLFCLDRAL